MRCLSNILGRDVIPFPACCGSWWVHVNVTSHPELWPLGWPQGHGKITEVPSEKSGVSGLWSVVKKMMIFQSYKIALCSLFLEPLQVFHCDYFCKHTRSMIISVKPCVSVQPWWANTCRAPLCHPGCRTHPDVGKAALQQRAAALMLIKSRCKLTSPPGHRLGTEAAVANDQDLGSSNAGTP